MTALLTPEQIREYISDYPEKNLLLDETEFSDTFIKLCMDLAVSEFNSISPKTSYSETTFPSKSLLLDGTLWKMFAGRAALMARNHLTYTDGGLQIPVEEKYELYSNLAAGYRGTFLESATKLKINQNMEAGWSSVGSDERNFPLW